MERALKEASTQTSLAAAMWHPILNQPALNWYYLV